MLNKQNIRQRTISTLSIEKGRVKSEFILRLIEGRLMINVAKLGLMYPYIRIKYGQEEWKSETSTVGGMKPKWNDLHLFPFISSIMEIIVFDKVFLFGETEIGRCQIYMEDVLQGHNLEWWSIISPAKEDAGAILLSFEFHEADVSSNHISNSSWDMKSYDGSESSPIVPKAKKIQSAQYTKRTPDYKNLHFSTEPDEINELEQVKYNLIRENDILKTQENQIRLIFEKLQTESDKLKSEKTQVMKSTETLKSKEESILNQRIVLENEKIFIEQDKKEIEKLKEKLNLSYSKIKQEKLKLRAHRKLLERNKIKLEGCYRKIDNQKNRLQKYSGQD
jgi:C2 domain